MDEQEHVTDEGIKENSNGNTSNATQLPTDPNQYYFGSMTTIQEPKHQPACRPPGLTEDDICKEWQVAALLLDWFFFAVFMIATTLCLAAVLYSNPEMKGDTYFNYVHDQIVRGEW